MKCYVTHKHSVVFSPRNEFAEEQAEITVATLRNGGIHPNVIDNNPLFIQVEWWENSFVQRAEGEELQVTQYEK